MPSPSPRILALRQSGLDQIATASLRSTMLSPYRQEVETLLLAALRCSQYAAEHVPSGSAADVTRHGCFTSFPARPCGVYDIAASAKAFVRLVSPAVVPCLSIITPFSLLYKNLCNADPAGGLDADLRPEPGVLGG